MAHSGMGNSRKRCALRPFRPAPSPWRRRTPSSVLFSVLVLALCFPVPQLHAEPIRPVPVDPASTVSDSARASTADSDRRPGSHMREGALAGAIVGGVGGAGFFVFIGALVSALNEGSDDVTPLGYVGLGVLGGALGGAAGALVGGLVGSAFPKKTGGGAAAPARTDAGPANAVPAAPDAEPVPADAEPADSGATPAPPASRGSHPEPASRRSIGSITLQPVAVAENFEGGGVLLTLLSRVTPVLHLGLEGGVLFSETDVRSGAVVTRIYPSRTAGVYFLGNIGVFSYRRSGFTDPVTMVHYSASSSTTLVGGGLGAGYETGWETLKLGIEARRHFNLQNINEPESYEYSQIGITLRHLW